MRTMQLKKPKQWYNFAHEKIMSSFPERPGCIAITGGRHVLAALSPLLSSLNASTLPTL
jgi:hypothetical protein